MDGRSAASTIASGLMAERTDFKADIIYSFIVGLLIYPIFGHWVWGGGWLQEMGLLDFAGGTVVHYNGTSWQLMPTPVSTTLLPQTGSQSLS